MAFVAGSLVSSKQLSHVVAEEKDNQSSPDVVSGHVFANNELETFHNPIERSHEDRRRCNFFSSRHSNSNNNDDNNSISFGERWKSFRDQKILQWKNVQSISGWLVNHKYVQLTMVVLIAINAILMGIGTYNFVTDDESVSYAFQLTDDVFLVIFTLELCLHFISLGFHLFADGWLVFDFLVIVVSWSFDSVQIIRAFRIFRALRMVTRVKVLKNLLTALFSVIPKLAAILLLLLVIFYIFAVMMTQLFKNLYQDNQTDQDYFSRLDLTFFTLFQMMTLDGWSDIAHQVMLVYSWAWLPFIGFVTISGFIIVNLMIAVICEAVSSLDDNLKAKIHGTFDEGEDYSISNNRCNVQEQLETVEGQFDEFERFQELTMYKFEYLVHKLQSSNCTVKV